MVKPELSIHKCKYGRMTHYAAGLLLLATSVSYCCAQTPEVCAAQSVFTKADSLLKLKHYEEAEVTLDQLQECHSLTDLERFNLGWFYGRARNFKTALKILETVPLNVPDPSTHQYAVALGQFELGDSQGAVATLKSLQAQGLLDAKGANLLGVSYSKLGLYQDAYPILAEELRQNPQDLLAYLNLVALFADSADFARAADIANQATLNFPHDSEVFVVLGAADTLLGNLAKAHGDFEKAAQLSPRQAEPRFFLALTDYKQNNFTRAIAELKAAIASGIIDSDLHYLLAECILKIDASKTKDSLIELNQAIEINPKSVSARTLRGRLLLEDHHPQQAIVDLEVAHNIDPNLHGAAYILARAYAAAGRKEDANVLFAHLSTQFHRDLEDQHNMEIMDAVSEQRLKQVLGDNASH
jgi:tetratricopeptide (TPR) repeat protein